MSNNRGAMLFGLLAMVAPAAGTAQDALRIDLMSEAPQAPWRIERLDLRVPATKFRAVSWDGVRAIESVADASMAMLARPLDVDLSRTPVLCWRWRVEAPVASADLATREGDDFAARLYVAYRLPSDALGWVVRTKLRMARRVYGEQVPDAAVNYVWDNRYPVGTTRANAYSDRAQMVVLRSGGAQANRWVSERRDLLADLQSRFGTDQPGAAFIAIASDTENTGEFARAGFADIHLTTRTAKCEFPQPQ